MGQLEDMQVFIRVVEAGGVGRAAEQLGIAKSAVSRRVSALEERLGAQLLRRTTRRLSLTDSGSGLYERGLRILADLDEAEAAVAEEHGELRGFLRIALPLSFGIRHMGEPIAEFSRLHPQIEFKLDLNDRRVDLIEEGADLAIRIGHTHQQSFIVRKLATINRVLCASTAYLARHGRPERPEDLARHNCIVYRQQPGDMTWQLIGADGTFAVAVSGNFAANNAGAIGAAMPGGVGIALLPVWLAGRDIKNGRVEVLLPEYRANPTGFADEVFAVFPHGRNLSAKVRAFVDFIAEKFRTEPDFQIGLDIEAA